MINTAYITAAYLSCDDQDAGYVIYRARLSSTPTINSMDLVNLLQEWVSMGSASVILEQIALKLDATCAVMISSFDDPICPAATTMKEEQVPTVVVETQTSQMVLLIAILAVVAGAMICIVVVVCAYCIIRTKFWRRRKYNIRSVQQL